MEKCDACNNTATLKCECQVFLCMSHMGDHLDLNHKIQKLNHLCISQFQLKAKKEILNRLENLDKTSVELLKYSDSIIQRTSEFVRSALKNIQIQKNSLFEMLNLAVKKCSEEENRIFLALESDQFEVKSIKELIPIYQRFEKGFFFHGELKNRYLDGKGTCYYDNGAFYDGELENGVKEGKGIFKSSEGNSFEGEWKKNKMHGIGTFKWLNGSLYKGDWKEGKREGRGTYIYTNGDVYEGEWKNEKKEGKGCYKYLSGKFYDGEWKNDFKEGDGVLKLANGEIRQGKWVKDKML